MPLPSPPPSWIYERFPVRVPAIVRWNARTERFDKKPALKSWNKVQTNQHNEERDYMILTGELNNLTIVDLDDHHHSPDDVSGIEWMRSFLPTIFDETMCVRSANGGLHLYFEYEPVLHHKCTRAISDHPEVEIDILGSHRDSTGHIISQNIMGVGSQGYTFLTEMEPQKMPRTLFDVLTKAKGSGGKRRPAHKPLSDALAPVATNLNFLHDHFELSERSPWAYERDESSQMIKFTNAGHECLVSKKMHDKPQSAVFLNLASKTAICNCLGNCGHKELSSTVYRQILNGFNLIVLNQQNEEGPYQALLKLVHDVGEDHSYKRLNGCVYRKIEGRSYAYERHLDGLEFMNKYFKDEPLFNSSIQMTDKFRKYLKEVDSSRFPFLKKDTRYIGFPNGVLDLESGILIPADEFTMRFPDTVCRHYIPGEISKDLATPLFDAFALYQVSQQDVLEMLYVMIGRLFFRVGVSDNWQVFMFLRGRANSGKGTMLSIIEAMFPSENVGTMDGTFESTFGYSALFHKDIVLGMDLPKNLFERLNPQMLQSMISGERVSCPVKGGEPITAKWTVPIVWGGNFAPDISTNAEAQTRRWFTFMWTNVMPEGERDLHLSTKIIEGELANLITKSVQHYLSFRTTLGSKSFWANVPAYFQRLRAQAMEEGSVILRFLNSETFAKEYKYDADSSPAITIGEFKVSFNQWLLNESGSKLSFKIDEVEGDLEHHGYKLLKNTPICIHCKKLHKKGCCDLYDRKDRTSGNFIGHMSRVIEMDTVY